MGTDIHGCIEFDWSHENNDLWRCGVVIDYLVGRSYDTFGSLFGVRNPARFDPIAPKRGIPDPCSDYVKENVWGHSQTYVTQAELEDVDWDGKALDFDERIAHFSSDGEYLGKASYSSSWDFSDEEKKMLNQGEKVWRNTTEDHIPHVASGEAEGDFYYQRQHQTRMEVLTGSWKWIIFEVMPQLAEWNGAEQTRLVVWFDS